VIIPGCFVGDAPHFDARIRIARIEGPVRFLADTGASRTILMDHDARILGISYDDLEPAPVDMVGIGGSVRSFLSRNVEIVLESDRGRFVLQQDLAVAQHDLKRLRPENAARILRIPSLLGRDFLSRFRFTCAYEAGIVHLER
jgi:hypothetical protein